MKISIIIPIYNIEDYISECVMSVLNQTYQNIEVILINDGSIDNSENICKELEKKDNRIKYIYKQNGGLSAARNDGIRIATGEYIMFIDGDDFLKNVGALNLIVNNLKENNSDVLIYKMIEFYQKINKYVDGKSGISKKEEYDNVVSYLENSIKDGTISVSACDKIVKRSIIQANDIYFNEDQKCMEDIDWSLMLYQYINTVNIVPETIYVYRKQRENSITYSFNDKKANLAMQLITRWIDFDYKEREDIKKLYYNYLAYQYTILLANINKKNSNKEYRKRMYEMRWLLDNNINFKVQKANKIYKRMGYNIMRIVLKTYLYIKSKGIYKV